MYSYVSKLNFKKVTNVKHTVKYDKKVNKCFNKVTDKVSTFLDVFSHESFYVINTFILHSGCVSAVDSGRCKGPYTPANLRKCDRFRSFRSLVFSNPVRINERAKRAKTVAFAGVEASIDFNMF